MRMEVASLGVFFLLAFVASQCNHLVEAITDPTDVNALIQVKAAIDPATIHPGSCLASWDFSLDPCDNRFKEKFACGIDCTADAAGVERVTSLQLDSSGYGGILSPAIGNLSQLRLLQVSGNLLGGEIPPTVGQLSQLMMLDFSSNNFTGCIPECIGSLKSLQTLNIAYNLLNGTIPRPLNQLVGLTELRVESNNLGGSLPDFSSLTQLQVLDASDNRFSGMLPRQLPPFLCSLSLKNNLLTGRVPQTIATLQQLNVLDLSRNHLAGALDDALLAHPSLQQLDLSNNRFTSLRIRHLQAVSRSQMVALDLNYNLISGPLPGFFTSMRKLSSLSLRHNFFHGAIPETYALKATAALAGIEPLERLLLDGNYLTGPLPARFMSSLAADSIAASFADNCLRSCPAKYSFCRGGNQKAESLCRIFNPAP